MQQGPPPLDWSGKAPFPFTRESTIRLDAEGHFWHDGVQVDHPGLARAMHAWLRRHPIDGRYVLENGYDWCYVTVDDTPYLVRSVRVDGVDGGRSVLLELSDGSEESIDPASICVDQAGALRCEVKRGVRGGPFPARFDRHAAVQIGEYVSESESGAIGAGGEWRLAIGGREVTLGRCP